MQALERLLAPGEINEAAGRWQGHRCDGVGLLTDKEDAGMLFAEYLIHDWRPDGGKGPTLLERFAEAESRYLPAIQRAQLEAWLTRRHRGWFEVESIDRDACITTLRDRMDGGTYRIFDVSLSSSARPGSMFLTAVFPCGDRWEMGGVASMVHRHLRTRFEVWLRREYERWSAGAGADPSWPRFFSQQSAEVERELDRMLDTPPDVRTSTGEPAAHGYAIYAVSDRRAVMEKLELSAKLEYRGPGEGNKVKGDSFGWPRKGKLPFERPLPGKKHDRHVLVMGSFDAGPLGIAEGPAEGSGVFDGRREDLATVLLDAKRLEVLANSTERLDYVRAALEKELGSLVSLVGVEKQAPDLVEKLWRDRGKSRGKGQRDTRPAELRELEREIALRERKAWLDRPVPPLNGKTPRQAAGDERLRPELEALLRDMEEREAYAPEPDNFAAWARRQLGMPE